MPDARPPTFGRDRTPGAGDDRRGPRPHTRPMTTPAPHPAPRTPRRRRRFAAAAIAASAIVASLGATVPAAGADMHAPEAKQPLGPRLQAVLDRAMQSPNTHFPGVALRVRVPGQGTWSGAAGTANLATKQ